MMKQVRETAAGSSIGAYIVLDKRGRHMATVQAHYAATARVDVFSVGEGERRCLEAAKKAGFSGDDMTLQQGRASGGGYDKITAALSGLYIDGHRMADHCGRDEKTERLFKRYRRAIDACSGGPGCDEINREFDKKAEKIGAAFANMETVSADGRPVTRAMVGTLGGESAIPGRPRYGYVLRDDIDKTTGDNFPPEYDGRVYHRWSSLFLRPGLERLHALGYRVMQAI